MAENSISMSGNTIQFYESPNNRLVIQYNNALDAIEFGFANSNNALSSTTARIGTSVSFGAGNYSLPNLDGTPDQVLKTNGSGVITWADSLTGPTGAQGAQGAQGPTGPTGPTGFIQSLTSGTGSIVLTNDGTYYSNSMVQVTTNLIVAGSIVPSAGYIYDLGSSANPWRDLYVSTGTIYLGPTGTINANASGNVTVNNRNLLFDGTDSVINSSTVTVSTITTTTLSATNTLRVTNNITAGGMFIGTSGATIGKLTIQATASNFSTSGLGYVLSQSTAISTYPTGVNIKASMYASGDVWTGGNFIVSSDQRIKKNVQNIDDFEALSDLRLIEPKKYEYVDYIQRGTNTVYGFLAQQVSSVFNDAVHLGTDFIPDYFQTISTIISFNNNSTYIQCLNIPQNYLYSLSTSRLIKMYDGENKQVIGSVSFLQSNSFSIVTDQTDIEPLSSCLFLYGKQVDDFQTLNKDYLFTLNFAATQEIDRILQSTISRVELLENIV